MNSLLLNKFAFQVFQKLKGATDTQRLRYLHRHYGSLPSTNHDKGMRHRKEDGLVTEDLLAIFNEIRSDVGLNVLTGQSLERKAVDNEDKKVHAERIHHLLHGSLKLGEAPILIFLRSQSIVNAKCVRLMGHYITVAELQVYPNRDGSFLMGYLDSEDGKRHTAFIYPDPRGFSAYSGHDDRKKLLKDNPFLTIAGADILLKTQQQPVSRRTVIYLDYAITAQSPCQ